MILEVFEIEDIAFMGIYLVLKISINAIIDLKSGRLLLNQKNILQFLKIVHIFYPNFMFLFIQNFLAGKIRFNNIFKTTIIPQ